MTSAAQAGGGQPKPFEDRGGSPPPDSHPLPRPPRPDDLLDALLAKLEKVSPVWTQTFAISPEIDVPAYRRLQRLLNTYGYGPVRHVLEMNLNLEVVPDRDSAMPLMTAWLEKMRESDAQAHRPSL